jgi:triosephosphate isomerase (TIM)
MHRHKKLVIANWKMNPGNLSDVKKLFFDVKKNASRTHATQVVICPPHIYIAELCKLYSGKKIAFGAQDVFWKDKNSHTGEVSSEQLKGAGVLYAIIGHSERRALWESNDVVNKKVLSALNEGLTVILCVGEKERDAHATHLTFVRDELQSALSGVSRKLLNRVVIAYEPIWAIGKTSADAITPAGMHEMSIFIKKILSEIYDRESAHSIPILYGGSAEPDNAEKLLKDGDINGFLVGHASLIASDFNRIIDITDRNVRQK